jgi:hypothetical protein
LNKIVPPNSDPELANTYHAIIYIFKFVNVSLSDGRQVVYTLDEEEIEKIVSLFDVASRKIFELTRGEINMKFSIRNVPVPLKMVTEEGKDRVNWPIWWVDPAGQWMINDFSSSEKKYFNYFMVWEPKAPLVPAIPGGASENHVGVAYWPTGWWPGDAYFVEVIVHEWLHCIDCMMVRIGYPDELVPNPDGGRSIDYVGNEPFVDPDYRRPLGETTWYGYYSHIMQEHITPRMWRRLVAEYVRP